MNKSEVSLKTELASLSLANPIMPASGTWSVISQMTQNALYPRFRPGALVTKGVTFKPRIGNSLPRLTETPSGLINSIGLPNPGLAVFLKEVLPDWLRCGVPVIVNISGADPEEYGELAASLAHTDISGIEVNLSCLNRAEKMLGTDPNLTYDTVSRVAKVAKVPVIAKLSPNVSDIRPIAQAAEAGGANVISAVNTFFGMRIDVDKERCLIGRGFGGVSGPAIKSLALYQVWRICQAVKIPVIGMGGISSASDAIEFFMAGATAIAVGTANFKNPGIMAEISQGLIEYLLKHGYASIAQIPKIQPKG